MNTKSDIDDWETKLYRRNEVRERTRQMQQENILGRVLILCT